MTFGSEPLPCGLLGVGSGDYFSNRFGRPSQWLTAGYSDEGSFPPETLLTFQVTAPVTVATNDAPQAFRFAQPADYPPQQTQSEQVLAYPAPPPYAYPYYVYYTPPYNLYYPYYGYPYFYGPSFSFFFGYPGYYGYRAHYGYRGYYGHAYAPYAPMTVPYHGGMIAHPFHGGGCY